MNVGDLIEALSGYDRRLPVKVLSSEATQDGDRREVILLPADVHRGFLPGTSRITVFIDMEEA